MVNSTKCPPADELRAMQAGRLPEEQSEELIAHVHHCAACQSDLETVDDREDSLIFALRQPSEFAAFEAEAECQVALAKALATLADRGSPRPEDDALPDLPRELGEYQIVRPLGQGGMGRVYVARHTKLGREVAIKVLASHRLGDERLRRRFEAEMQAVGRLSHPHIVTAHDAREIAGTAVLVTELIDGMDVGQLVRRTGPLPVADACELVRQAAVALEYTHGQGFVHRDIKPSNLMLSRDGQLKLLDLGLARLQLADADRSEMTGTGQTMGTADYIAPEQVMDSRNVDGRADIYSLGCTLYKMLTGEAPFAGDDHQTVFAKLTAHVSSAAPSLASSRAEAPGALVKLVDAMLAKDPAERPQTPRDVAEQLAKWTAGHELASLVARAERIAPDKSPRVRTASAVSNARPLPVPLLRRRVPVGVLIATTLVALGLGVMLGLIIRIKHPDGTETVVQVPEGASVEVVEGSEGAKEGAKSRAEPSAPTTEKPSAVERAEIRPSDAPLTLIYPRDELLQPVQPADGSTSQASPAQLNNANEGYVDFSVASLHKKVHPVGFGVVDLQGDGSTGILFKLADGVLPQSETRRRGDRMALVRTSSDAIIGWSDIQGRLSVSLTQSNKAGELGLTLVFDEALGSRMHRLTEKYQGQHLALIVNGRIIVAPRIVSTISQQASLQGNFRREDLESLMQALSGLMNDVPDATPY
jgi:serine/threonine protein kinase